MYNPNVKLPHNKFISLFHLSYLLFVRACSCLTEQLVHSSATCDSTCLLAIILSLGGAVVVMVTAVTWRIKRKRPPVSKHVGSIVSLSAIPSDYIDDHERQIAAYIAVSFIVIYTCIEFRTSIQNVAYRHGGHIARRILIC